ncbi:MAG: ornithine carbamoyltransferase [Deltaproteobacteria bacterium]|nr:ornithine carbamoyltransferase [Deltaproteobacteria bacterium]
MPVNVKGRDFITLADFSTEEILHLLDTAREQKQQFNEHGSVELLKGRTLACIFQKPSLRTRVSLEVAMIQLGGSAVSMTGEEIGPGSREPVGDIARVLSRYVDVIAIRTFDHSMVEELARYARVPVINALTDYNHPCQVLADLQTILEVKGRLKGLKLAYVGDGNNVAVSLLLGTSLMGMSMSLGCPEGYDVPEKVLEQAREEARKRGAGVDLTRDPREAVRGADVVYTDVWASMGQESEADRRRPIFKPYQVNNDLLKDAREDAVVMHCLPAHYGDEITAEVVEGPRSVVFDQAENRLHAQKAILLRILG